MLEDLPANAEVSASIAERTRVHRRLRALLELAEKPHATHGLAFLRIAFGLTMFVSCLRFLGFGWATEYFSEPTFTFKYQGLEFVPTPSAAGAQVLFALLAVFSLCIAVGLFYRASVVLFGLGFAYVNLIDVTNYLNHYYLVLVLTALLALMPLGEAWSVDAWRADRGHQGPRSALERFRGASGFPAWCTWVLRAQVAIVYFYAGIAKLNADWLLSAQPLGIWLHAKSHLPLIGPLLSVPAMAYVFSWAGFLYDTTIWLFLLLPRTRLPAYVVVIFFHTMTSVLFPIGMFPVIMTVAALVFFSPAFPRVFLLQVRSRFARWRGDARVLKEHEASQAHRTAGTSSNPWVRYALAAHFLFQLVFPLRRLLTPGPVAWHEQGMRFAWNVMVREKNGSVNYRVALADGRTFEVSPARYLDGRQAKEFATQPDLIAQLGRHIGAEYKKRFALPCAVYADAFASWNGRRATRLIDPTVDLMTMQPSGAGEDSGEPTGKANRSWILPAPTTPPLRIGWSQTTLSFADGVLLQTVGTLERLDVRMLHAFFTIFAKS
jgi:vitamin K-dependent gamma-carboxylase